MAAPGTARQGRGTAAPRCRGPAWGTAGVGLSLRWGVAGGRHRSVPAGTDGDRRTDSRSTLRAGSRHPEVRGGHGSRPDQPRGELRPGLLPRVPHLRALNFTEFGSGRGPRWRFCRAMSQEPLGRAWPWGGGEGAARGCLPSLGKRG